MCLLLACSATLYGGQQNQASPGNSQLGPNAPTHLTPAQTLQIPLLEHDLSLADFQDMQPSPALRDKLAHIAELSQNQPFDTKPASEKTEVWLGRTHTTLFAVFVCYDSRPNLMRAHLARRENIDQDDYVSLLVDPFQDRRRGILFEVNPLGVQADANWTENNDPDFSYDQIWDSSARRTPKGWIAVMAIPFRSIRSRATAPDWGIIVGRNMPRLSEQDYWPHISQQVSGTLSQEGTAHGLEGATSHNIQINPYALAHRIRELNDDDPLKPYFSNRNFAGTAGGDIKAIVKDSIVLDGTINPDFSQVESDQPQFRVNQRFAVYYPELRPFFLENSSFFDAPITLLYTRTIIHPEFGARATGKIGRTNIGFLTIDDRAPGEFVAQDDPLHGKRSLTTMLRVSQDIGKQSSIGVSYAQRVLNGKANRVGGIDFNAYLNKHWTLNGMWVESSTQQQDGTYSAGPANRLGLYRSGRSFNLNIRYRDFSQGYEADAGFTTIPQVRQVNSNASYSWYPNRHGIQSVQIQPQFNTAFDRAGNRVFHYNENDLILTLPRNGLVVPFVGNNSDTLSPASYPALQHYTNFTENYTGALVRLAPIPQFNTRLTYVHGATVNYNPAGAGIPELLHEDQLRGYLTLQPVGPLTIDNTYLLDRTTAAHNDPQLQNTPTPAPGSSMFRAGNLAYESQTLRTKVNYQFTRSFSLRAIVEYDSVLANPLVTTLARTKQVSSQVLFTWLPHPGTAVYVGYNNALENLDRSLCYRNLSGACDPNNTDVPYSPQYLATGRELFVKASYLLRF
ncbi:carbohydrate binding family 9 domain-containing protein [Terriglobus aquaticus]|uniref:DUF5916 domain-containing protein n=1 Tax=Terriglobus aquaticus TaxID=940139 RepID=A0ABW9KRR8_9BACT|nr:carbohydrate binding family 9 domain-containing protein [Terriglobus aquaticus]